jgi:hypothetical protein
MRSLSNASVMALAVLGCQSVLNVDRYSFIGADAGSAAGSDPTVAPSRPEPSPAVGDAAPGPALPSPGTTVPAEDAAAGNTGAPPVTPEAPDEPASEAPGARPIGVDGPALEVAIVGNTGTTSAERVGACRGGVMIGVRQIANTDPGAFSRRLSFVEPICGRVVEVAPESAGAGAATLAVVEDASLIEWTAGGAPTTPPDYALPPGGVLWTPLPPVYCPLNAPVVGALFGAYTPSAPEAGNTVEFAWLGLSCSPLVSAANGVDVGLVASDLQVGAFEQTVTATWEGEVEYNQPCAPGAVATQMRLFSGFWLDGFVLGCSTLRRPALAGSACTDARDCQSNVCGPGGTCAP